MALTTVNFTTTFNKTTSPKTFDFVDTTDYSVTTIANCDGVFKIVSPDGLTHYNNTSYASPDINPNTSTSNTTTITLPLVDGAVQQGDYVITYSVQDTTVGTLIFTETKTISYTYDTPTVSLTQTINCLVPKVVMTDATNYTQDNIIPTIVRAMKLHYPPSLNLSDITGTGITLSTTVVYTGAQSGSTTTTLTYTYSDHTVSDSVTGDTAYDVVCDGDLCDIYCCMSSTWTRYTNNKSKNPSFADGELTKWIRMMGLSEMIRTALECGKDTDISGYRDEILELGDCKVGCGCNDGDPVAVTGLGATGNTVAVASGGAPITVSSAEAGGITTYTVTLAAATVSKINAQYNTVVAAGTGISVAIATAADGTKTYTVTNTTTPTDLMSFDLTINLTNSAVPTFGFTNITTTGSYFLGDNLNVDNRETTFSVWEKSFIGFELNTFLEAAGAGAQVAKPLMQVISSTPNDAAYVDKFSNVYDQQFPYNLQIVKSTATTVQFRFVDANSNALVPGSKMVTGVTSYFPSQIVLSVILTA